MAQAKIAEQLGYDTDHIKILSSGDVLEINEDGAKVTGRVHVGNVMVDGLGVGDVGNIVLRDRQRLAEDGIIIVVMTLEAGSGQLLAGPDIVSRGFVYVQGFIWFYKGCFFNNDCSFSAVCGHKNLQHLL